MRAPLPLAVLRPLLAWLGAALFACCVAAAAHAQAPAAQGKAGASPEAWRMAASLGRGINFGNMLDAPKEGAWGLRVEERFIQLVGTPGFPRTVRLPVRWSNHASADAQARIDPTFMARVAGVVDQLLARGATVILNMHHYRQLDGDPPDPGDRVVDASVLEARFLAMWRQIAQHFAAKDARLLFEVYNEPHGRLDKTWNGLMAQAVSVIRASNPARLLVVGPVRWNSPTALPELVLPGDAHLILTVHHYEPFDYTHQGAEWVQPQRPVGLECCDAKQLSLMHGLLDQAVREAARLGYPVFVGEFGANEKAGMASRVRYTRAMREAMESRGLPWQYWELAAGFGVYDPMAGRMRPELAAALFGPPAPTP